MSLSKLAEITKSLHLTDTERVTEQGRSAYRAGFQHSANPLRTDFARQCWDRGYREEEEKFTRLLKKWREADRSER